MGYINRLLYPEISIALRGGILISIIAVSIAIYYEGMLGTPVPILYERSSAILGLRRILTPQLIDTLVQVLLVSVVGAVILRNRLFTGLVKGLTIYAVAILLLSAITMPVMEIMGWDGSAAWQTITAIVLIVVALILYVKYPPIALSISYITPQGRKTLETEIIAMNPRDHIEIRVYGSPDLIEEEYDEGSIDVEKNETLTGLVLRIRPKSIQPSEYMIKYGGKLALSIRIRLLESSIKTLRYRVFFNDDEITEAKISSEPTKTLLAAAEPIVKSVISRIGLSVEDVREIQFYTENNLYLNPQMRIGELETDTIQVKIYSVEKHMELLKYYKAKDVYELWDKLMRRLEYLGRESDELFTRTRELLSAGKILLTSWW